MPPRLHALFACGVFYAGLAAQEIPVAPPAQSRPIEVASSVISPDYLLGAGDEISVRVLDLDEIPDRPARVNSKGDINLPLIGEMHAAGLTVSALQSQMEERLRAYLKKPAVTLNLTSRRDQPITVAGAVNSPGVRQLGDRRNLLDALSEAGGLKAGAGDIAKITRQASAGPIPLPTNRLEPGGHFYTAEVGINSLLHAQNPGENIPLLPHDLIAVPPAGLVYVLGEVGHPGGYEFKDGRSMSVLDAVAFAGGANRNASAAHVRVLRKQAGNADRTEIVLDLNRILAGKARDFQLQPADILYLPTNRGKVVTTRTLEAMIGTGSSIAVFRGSK